MNQPDSIAWKRISVEAVAIVASILLAFSIDAWWDSRRDDIDQIVVLEALLVDLREKKQGLAEALQYNNAILDAVITLLNEGGNPDSSLYGTELDNTIESTWWWNPSTPWESPPIQALFAGELRLISNQELVQELSELRLLFGEIQDFYRRDEYVHQAIYTPFLIENAYMPQLVNAGTTPGYPNDPDPYPDIDSLIIRDHSTLLHDEEFHNILVTKMDTIDSIIRYGFAGVDEKLDIVIQMIEMELGVN